MLIILESFDGHDINNANYKSIYLTPNSLPAANVVFIEEAMADSVDAGTYTVENRSVPISITILVTANRDALVGQLKSWFRRGTEGLLKATFRDEGVLYQLSCRVQNLIQDPDHPQHFTAMLVTGETAWRSVSVETDTWAVSGTGGTKAITVHGDDETRLIASFTATAAPSGIYLYQKLYRLVNVVGIDYGNRPWCIVMDTAALVTAAKMRADCYDLRIFNGSGNQLHRWVEDPNTDHTHIWFNVHIGPGYSLTLRTAIADSGDIDYIEFAKQKDASGLSILSLPASGVLYHGTEWIHYESKDIVNYRLAVDQRGVFDTTLQAHSIDDEFLFIETPLIVCYGNPAAEQPAAVDPNYNNRKPVFNLSASDNNSWVYDANSVFYDPLYPVRPGSWMKYIQCSGNVSKLFWITQDGESGAPVVGMKLGCWYSIAGPWLPASGTLAWSLSSPGGIAEVSAAGHKYRSTVRWPATAALQRSADKVNWYNVWNEATPASVSTWTAWNHADAAMASGTKHVRFCVSPSLALLFNAYASLQATAVTVEFVTANLPTSSLGAEKSNYAMDLDLVNNENDDQVELYYPMRLSTEYRVVSFLLDGENYRATYDKHGAHRALLLDDESRSVWLRLKPGTNELEITSPGAGTLAVALSWYRRHL